MSGVRVRSRLVKLSSLSRTGSNCLSREVEPQSIHEEEEGVSEQSLAKSFPVVLVCLVIVCTIWLDIRETIENTCASMHWLVGWW